MPGQIDSLHFWLRAEVKPLEKRTPLMPEHAQQLLQSGHRVTVERSLERCIPDEEYEKIGCTIVEAGTWKDAPKDTIILGLKELPETNDPLTHRHVYFAHCYKEQSGWKELLKRFTSGNGTILDLEFLVDENGRRVAAFGRSAGFIGMAVGLKAWCEQQISGETLKRLDYYSSSEALIKDIKKDLENVYAKTGKRPSALIMGALGRCGRGAVSFAEKVGLADVLKWDLEETKKGGPFKEILDADIFINCIYLSTPIPPFLTTQLLQQQRKLSVMVDVSCDTFNPRNPVPVYTETTSFVRPTVRVIQEPAFDVIAIDHLPSLVPTESSGEFSEQLIPHLQNCCNSPVWSRAEKLFHDKCKSAA